MHIRIALLIALLVATSVAAQETTRPATRPANRPATPKPTHVDLKYGPHERHLMDVWVAKSDKPTPLLIFIHGGGFLGGNKFVMPPILRGCLANGISVIAITYRYSSQAIAPAPMQDGARALQFIRTKAKEWNIDPTRIAAAGNSAGAGISLWLAFHNDLADPNHLDPVLRESTRVKCAVGINGQPTYDPRVIKELFPEFKVYEHHALPRLFGGQTEDPDKAPPERIALYNEASALPHLTPDDPPVMLTYDSKLDTPITNISIGIHHPRLGKLLKDKMDQMGLECILHTGEQHHPEVIEFIKRHLEVK